MGYTPFRTFRKKTVWEKSRDFLINLGLLLLLLLFMELAALSFVFGAKALILEIFDAIETP